MDTANELSAQIVALIKKDEGMTIEMEVNDEVTEDSVVEHVTDLDVKAGDYVYNVRLTVIRFGLSQPGGE